jgi:hypothetical protein
MEEKERKMVGRQKRMWNKRGLSRLILRDKEEEGNR